MFLEVQTELERRLINQLDVERLIAEHMVQAKEELGAAMMEMQEGKNEYIGGYFQVDEQVSNLIGQYELYCYQVSK